ncbi:energy-coupling factor transporter transmembrane component T family protein [Sharpea azabuensis]|uniref:energy-coupling factor transporter transmembrane component T family protein n=1 Tax=Sharpea azabuensis TaxID=322505 RepID=UPI0013DCA395|nr:energy-coupling factor transporter transmembrane protein EcfT [Sharpea azabuensis]
MNDIVFGQYLPGHSIIHRLDPRLKIASLLLLLIAVFFDAGFIGYGLIGLFVLLALLLSRIPFKRVLKSMKPMIFMVLFLTIFNLFFVRIGHVVYRLGPVPIYSGAIRQTEYIVVRLVLIICLTTMLTSTTKPLDMTLGLERLMKPLRKVGFPVHEVAMMISIALRFIPTLMEETQRIMKAQASRGVDFNEGTFKEKIAAIVSLIIPLFISAFQRAEDLANAMESRNYNPSAKRTRFHQLHWRHYDTIAITLVLCLFFGIWGLSFIL